MKLLLRIVLLSMLVYSCKKDNKEEDPLLPSTDLIINGTTFTIDKGFIENYGTDSTSYEGTNIDLNLLTSGLEVFLAPNDVDSVQGSGYVLYFEIFTGNSEDLAPGTYHFDPFGKKIGTFDIAEVFDIINGNVGSNYSAVTGGSITVSKSGSTYTIDGTLEMFNGEDLRVYYQGTMPMLDYR